MFPVVVAGEVEAVEAVEADELLGAAWEDLIFEGQALAVEELLPRSPLPLLRLRSTT